MIMSTPLWFVSETAGCPSGRKEEEREGMGAEEERSGGVGGEAEGRGGRDQEEAPGAGGGEGVAAEEERGVPERSGEDAGSPEEAGKRQGDPEERHGETGGREERWGQGPGASSPHAELTQLQAVWQSFECKTSSKQYSVTCRSESYCVGLCLGLSELIKQRVVSVLSFHCSLCSRNMEHLFPHCSMFYTCFL